MIQIAQCTPTKIVPQILPHRRHRRCFLITHGNLLLAIRHWNDLASWLLAAVYCLLWSVQFITATAHKQTKLTGINPWIIFFTLCFSWAKLVAAVWGWSGREGNARVARLIRFRVHWIPFDHKFTMEMAAMAHVTWHGCCRAQPSSPLTSHAIKEPTTAKLLCYILQGVFLWCYNSSAWLFALILVRGWYWSQILVGDTVGYIGQILCFLLDVSFRCNVGFSGWILWKHFSFSICKNSEKKFSQDPFFLKKKKSCHRLNARQTWRLVCQLKWYVWYDWTCTTLRARVQLRTKTSPTGWCWDSRLRRLWITAFLFHSLLRISFAPAISVICSSTAHAAFSSSRLQVPCNL